LFFLSVQLVLPEAAQYAVAAQSVSLLQLVLQLCVTGSQARLPPQSVEQQMWFIDPLSTQ
jgi:hypothetical protein